MDITVLKNLNPDRKDDKTDNTNYVSIKELLISDEENPTNNDRSTANGATILDHNNSNEAPNGTNNNDFYEDDIPKRSPLRYRQNMIHPYKDRNHYQLVEPQEDRFQATYIPKQQEDFKATKIRANFRALSY